MARFLPLLLCLAGPLGVGAQAVPDTTEPSRYFPLHLGDEWQYSIEVEVPNACIPSCRYTERRIVTGTTVIDGQSYFTLFVRTYDVPVMPNPPPASTTRYVRFDTAAAAPVQYLSEEWYFDGGGCRLDEAFPAPSDSASGRPITCPSGPGTVYGSPAPAGSTFGAEKGFSYFTFGWQWSRYQAGLGLLWGGGCEGGCYMESLAYARVGGVEFGAPIIVAAEGGVEATEAIDIAASPNPTRGVLLLTVRLQAGGLVMIEAFDALGRRVHREQAEWPAGSHSLAVNAATWAPGAYVVRAASGGVSTIAPIIRL